MRLCTYTRENVPICLSNGMYPCPGVIGPRRISRPVRGRMGAFTGVVRLVAWVPVTGVREAPEIGGLLTTLRRRDRKHARFLRVA